MGTASNSMIKLDMPIEEVVPGNMVVCRYNTLDGITSSINIVKSVHLDVVDQYIVVDRVNVTEVNLNVAYDGTLPALLPTTAKDKKGVKVQVVQTDVRMSAFMFESIQAVCISDELLAKVESMACTWSI